MSCILIGWYVIFVFFMYFLLDKFHSFLPLSEYLHSVFLCDVAFAKHAFFYLWKIKMINFLRASNRIHALWIFILIHRFKLQKWTPKWSVGFHLFSSPGPKVHVNYCHHLASVVCRLSSVVCSLSSVVCRL